MTENQKLREALLSDMDIAVLRMPVHLAFAGNMAQFQYHNRVQALLARIEALALPTAEQVDDINVAESFTSVTKTAAPVGERDAFEQVIVEAVGSGAIRRWPNEKGESYENARVQDYRQGWLWGIEWQARAALAGDAADAQRLDFIEKSARCDPKMDGQHVWWPTSLNKALKGPTLRAAIDAAMRKESE